MKPDENERDAKQASLHNQLIKALDGRFKKEGKANLSYKSATLPGYKPTLSRSPPPKGATRCNCCPYGYHIDLGFVHYCENLYSGAYLEKLKQLHKDRRKQRKSMETRMGVTNDNTNRKMTEKNLGVTPLSPIVPKTPQHPPPDLIHTSDALREAVLDFEETLNLTAQPGSDSSMPILVKPSPEAPVDLITSTQHHVTASTPLPPLHSSSLHTINQSSNIPQVSPYGNFRMRSESASSVSSQSSMSSIGMPIHLSADFSVSHNASQQMADTVATLNSAGFIGSTSSPGFVGINRLVLTQIREQMAISLRRMKELEEQAKSLPVLQVKLSVLKEEKRLLMLQLKSKAGKYDQVSLGGDVNFSDKLSTDEEDPDSRLDLLGSRGIVTPRLRGRFKSGDDDFVSPPKLADCLNIALACKERFDEQRHTNGNATKGIQTSQGQLLTRDVGVGHVANKLVSVGVGGELGPVSCSKCKRKMGNHSVLSTSSDLSESDSDALTKTRPVKNRTKLNCVRCKERDAKIFVSKLVNTEPSSPKLPGSPETRSKLETIFKQRTDSKSPPEKRRSLPSPIPCVKCVQREKNTFKSRPVNTGVNTDTVVQSKEKGVGTDLVMNQVVDLKDIKKKTTQRGTDPMVISVMPASVQTTKEKTTPSRSVGVGSVPTSVKSIGVGNVPPLTRSLSFRKTPETKCASCTKPKSSVGVGNYDVKVEDCSQCNNKRKNVISKGVGECTISEDFCEKCHLKQTESRPAITIETQTVGVNTTLPSTLPDLSQIRANSAGLRICDKCNETIQSVAKDFVDNNQVSPASVVPSRIPRLRMTPGDNKVQSLSASSSANATLSRSFTTSTKVVRSESVVVTKKESQQKKLTTFATFENLHSNLDATKSGSSTAKSITEKKPETMRLPDSPVITTARESSFESASTSSCDSEGESEGAFSNPGVISAGYDPLQVLPRQKIELSKEMKAACKVLNDYLVKPERGDGKKLNTSLSIIQKEWFKVAAYKKANPITVENYLDGFEEFSRHLLNRVVNSGDANGNTAMHYAVSNGNFDVVSVLLDSKVCDINKQNKAGYTCTMLVSLAEIKNETHKQVVQRLFQLGDVNIKATQNGQTALMLAVSHGRLDMVKLLLEAGAWVNLQDNDGSTALMCAAEHGHIEIIKLILAHPDCDPALTDNDGSTALTIAMEAEYRDVGLLIYASMNFSRGSSPYSSLRGRRRNSTPRSTPPPSRTPPPPSPGRSRRSSSSLA